MALGAPPASVLRLVQRDRCLQFAGITLGVAAAWFATRALASLVFEVKPADLPAFAACYFPARRATPIDPLESLRAE